MTVQDQISDMITRIRNSVLVKHSTVAVNKSKVNNKILEVLSNEGFISEFEENISEKTPNYSIKLKYYDDGSSAITGLKRVSKPGLKIYVKKDEIPTYFSGMGVAVMSTSKGVMSDSDARKNNLGGEIICRVF